MASSVSQYRTLGKSESGFGLFVLLSALPPLDFFLLLVEDSVEGKFIVSPAAITDDESPVRTEGLLSELRLSILSEEISTEVWNGGFMALNGVSDDVGFTKDNGGGMERPIGCCG